MMHKCLLLVALGALVACQAEDQGNLEVTICGDLMVPEQLDAVRVSVLDKDRQTLGANTIELLQCPAEVLIPLPQTLTLPMPEDDLWVVAQGLRGGIEVITNERRVREAPQGARVRLGLTRDCMGQTCALGQTCVQGLCVATAFHTGFSPCESRPDPDMGLSDVDAQDLPDAQEAQDLEDVDLDAADALDTPDAAPPDVPSLCPEEFP